MAKSIIGPTAVPSKADNAGFGGTAPTSSVKFMPNATKTAALPTAATFNVADPSSGRHLGA